MRPNSSNTFQGIAASPGISIGKAFVLQRDHWVVNRLQLSGDEKDTGDILSGDEKDTGDILSGEKNDDGGILGGDAGSGVAEDADGATAKERSASRSRRTRPRDPQNLSVHGGWYRKDYSLLYRPARHADGFMREWLNMSAGVKGSPEDPTRRLFAYLTRENTITQKNTPQGQKDTPGRCVKCHSVENNGAGALKVNWLAARPTPGHHAFTKFSHSTHFSLVDQKKGCRTCHTEVNKPKYRAQFQGHDDTTNFVSSFNPIDQSVCETCHTASAAGDSCLTCHNYHVGTFPPVVVKTNLYKDPGSQASGAQKPDP